MEAFAGLQDEGLVNILETQQCCIFGGIFIYLDEYQNKGE